jgi:Holliday junction DNA helicase RuvA
MIAFLRGRVAARTGAYCLLDVGGVGYRVFMPTSALADLPAEGQPVTVLTHLQVREDDWSLYGFLEEADRELFELLISISGVGPKVALSALSALGPDALVTAIASEDVAAVSSIPGVGKKTAARIIVELKDKLGAVGYAPAPAAGAAGTPAHAEARDALLSMGFAPAEASTALAGLTGDTASELLKQALKRLGGAS